MEDRMNVEVRLFATLSRGRFESRHMVLRSPCTLRQLMEQLGIGEAEAPLRFVNGRFANLDDALNDRDIVSLFPSVGGG